MIKPIRVKDRPPAICYNCANTWHWLCIIKIGGKCSCFCGGQQ